MVECQLSAWSEWSSCDRSCGKGIQSRTRVIVQHPSPGKPPCGALDQKRGCIGTRCSRRDRKYKRRLELQAEKRDEIKRKESLKEQILISTIRSELEEKFEKEKAELANSQ